VLGSEATAAAWPVKVFISILMGQFALQLLLPVIEVAPLDGLPYSANPGKVAKAANPVTARMTGV
jgi:hypothetical protein